VRGCLSAAVNVVAAAERAAVEYGEVMGDAAKRVAGLADGDNVDESGLPVVAEQLRMRLAALREVEQEEQHAALEVTATPPTLSTQRSL
jgi:hypothetical protein